MKSFLLVGLPILLCCCSAMPPAGMILINGNIYTLDVKNPKAVGLAIREGKILFAGTSEEALKYKTANTRVIDLNGKTVIPGLIESHGHFMAMGFNKMELDLHNIASFEELVSKVSEAVAHAAPGQWILGRGWHQSKWSHIPGETVNGFPTHRLLSSVSPDNPVFLYHESGHGAMANAKAMEIAGVNRNTVYTGDGEILKDKKGEPAGIFTEGAASLVEKYIPRPGPSEIRKAFHLAMEECLKNGISTFQDAGQGAETISFYKTMLDSSEFKVRLYVMILGSDTGFLDDYLRKGPEIGLHHDYLTIRSIKLFADGALGSRGAWLLQPYSDLPGHTGGPAEDSAFIYSVALKGLKHGFQVCTHAIGDRANREVLNIYEQAFREVPDAKDPRFRIEHAQHLSLQDIPRFARLGVIASMQTIHLSSDRLWAIDRLGEERIREGAYVWQKLLQSGARVIDGTDVPVEPLDPIANFYAAVTRKTLQGTPAGGYEPDQKMTREQALRSYTLDAAFGAFEENKKGSIEPGKYADLTVLSQDLMTVPEDEILKTQVLMTIIDGKIAFSK